MGLSVAAAVVVEIEMDWIPHSVIHLCLAQNHHHRLLLSRDYSLQFDDNSLPGKRRIPILIQSVEEPLI